MTALDGSMHSRALESIAVDNVRSEVRRKGYHEREEDGIWICDEEWDKTDMQSDGEMIRFFRRWT